MPMTVSIRIRVPGHARGLLIRPIERSLLCHAPPHSEAHRILAYVSSLAGPIASIEDLHDAITNLDNEEELAAFRCAEGVAVSVASQGTWVLFTA